MPIWARIKGMLGGNPEDEAAIREEYGGDDPGEADEHFLEDSPGTQGGIAAQDAADVVEADFDEMKPPRDLSP
jgi:hypothetical protein